MEASQLAHDFQNNKDGRNGFTKYNELTFPNAMIVTWSYYLKEHHLSSICVHQFVKQHHVVSFCVRSYYDESWHAEKVNHDRTAYILGISSL